MLPDLRVASSALAVRLLDEAEVEHLDEVVVVVLLDEEDVARLDVAVDDAERVRLAQRAATCWAMWTARSGGEAAAP